MTEGLSSSEAPPPPRPSAAPSPQSDEELVRAFLDDKQDAAFVELVRRHQIPIFRLLSVELADPDDAEAVCEAVFLVASRRLEEWPGGDLRDWLFDVAREVLASRKGEAADPTAPRFVDPAVFFKHSVHKALHSLTEDERAVMIAVDLEGQSVADVAASRTASAEHVTETLHRARDRFTEALSTRESTTKSGAPEPVRVLPGEIIDKRYRVEELLGEGGMAKVFRAEHLAIKRKVAMKTLHPTRQTEAMIRERFVREAEVLGKLAHPNFVSISDFGESTRGLSYLVMELLDGRALSAELEETGRLPPLRALKVVREVCNGLVFAHEMGIVHRDIKPDNVVVLKGDVTEGFAKILDLGVAATGEDLTAEGTQLYGTPAYMAPEQILGNRIDGRVDLYALGVTLFELLTGELPFEASTTQFLLVQHMTVEPPKLADVAPDLPEIQALQGLLDACLAKKPEDRVKTATRLREQLDAVIARLPGSGASLAPALSGAPASAVPAPSVAVPSPTRRPPTLLLVGICVVFAGAVLWWLFR